MAKKLSLKEKKWKRTMDKGTYVPKGLKKKLSGINKKLSKKPQTIKKRKKYARPGRPKGSYKYGIPAKEHYKRLRQMRKRQEIQAQQVDIRRARELSRRGVSPEQIDMAEKFYEQQAIRRSFSRPIKVIQEKQPTRINQEFPTKPARKVVVDTDLMTSRRFIRDEPTHDERWVRGSNRFRRVMRQQ